MHTTRRMDMGEHYDVEVKRWIQKGGIMIWQSKKADG